jgi:hypothetical protein
VDEQQQPFEIPTSAEASADVTRRLHETIGRLFHEGIELKAKLDAAEQHALAVQVAAERLKAHYESAWMPRPPETTPDEGA